jgi:hypothetical protein
MPPRSAESSRGGGGGGTGAAGGGGGGTTVRVGALAGEEPSCGFSTRKTLPQELHRAFTPLGGTFAESTGKDVEHDGHETVMTM